MFLVFGSELFNKKLKIFWKEIRKKIKIIVTNGIENDKNSLIEFKYKFYFEKMFFLLNDENKKNYFKKKHILLIYLEKLNEHSSLFLIDFLFKDKTLIGIFKLRENLLKI